jgi:hypothetical protein
MPATPTKKANAPAAKARATKASATKAPAAKPRTVKAPAAKTPAAKTPATKTTRPRVSPVPKSGRAASAKRAADRATELSQEVFTSVEAGQRAALAAVRRFVDTVDEALPALGEHPSRRESVIDAALDMADKLVTTQYDFLRSVVRSADRSLHR